MNILKDASIYFWNVCPWWIKWPFVVIVGPNLTVNALIFYFCIVPWTVKTINATITPMKERRDVEIANIISTQQLQNDAIIVQLRDLKELNKMALEAALKR